MFFTQDDYKKIQQWLTKNSVRDTEFNEANIPFNGGEIITVVQDNQNKKVPLRDLVSQIFNLGVSDFINVTDKYDAPNIDLNEAIKLIPSRARKKGQVITFLNKENLWQIYQFKGALNQWNVLDQWEDLFANVIIDSILPDEEDLTKSLPDKNGNSYLSLKDREYNPEDFSGLGRVILRKNIVEIEDPIYGKFKKNILYQDMIDKENTIYVIQYDFTLGENITVPANCVLEFDGGSVRNGTLKFNEECDIHAGEQQIFYNITIDAESEPYSHEVNVKWWGAKGDGVTDDAAAIQAAVDSIRTSGYDSSNDRRAYSITLKAKSAKFFNISSTILITPQHTCSLDWDMIRCINHNTTALHLQGVSGSVIRILCIEKITDDPEGILHIGDWNNTQSQGIVAENIYDDDFYIGSINYFTRGFVAWANIYPAAIWNNNFHINRIAAAHEGFIIKTSGSAWANGNHLYDCKFHCISSNTSGGTTRVCDIKFECGDKQVKNNPINSWIFERCSSEGAKVVNGLPKASVYIETDANSTWVRDVVFRDFRIELITSEYNKPQVYVDHKSSNIIFDNPILDGYDRIIAVYTDDVTTEANANIVVDKKHPSVQHEIYFDSPKQYSRLKHYDFAEYINTLGFNYFIKGGEIVPFTINGNFSYKVKQKSTSTAYTKWYYGGLPSIILDTKKVFDLYFVGLHADIYLLDSSYSPIYQATVENNISFNKTMHWSEESADYPRYLYHNGGNSIRILSNGTPQDVKYILVSMIGLDGANKGTLDIYSSSDSEYPIVKTPVMEKAMLYDAYIMPSALTSSITSYLSTQTIEKDAVFYSINDDKYYKCYIPGTVSNSIMQGTYTSGSNLVTITSSIERASVGAYILISPNKYKITAINGSVLTLNTTVNSTGSGNIYFCVPRFKEINKEAGTAQERPVFARIGQIYFDTDIMKHIYVSSIGGSEYSPAPVWAALDGGAL